jgi:hypothetical protein
MFSDPEILFLHLLEHMLREKPGLFNLKAYGLSISDGHKECQW